VSAPRIEELSPHGRLLTVECLDPMTDQEMVDLTRWRQAVETAAHKPPNQVSLDPERQKAK